MAEYIIAIDVARVRFPADSTCALIFQLGLSSGLAGPAVFVLRQSAQSALVAPDWRHKKAQNDDQKRRTLNGSKPPPTSERTNQNYKTVIALFAPKMIPSDCPANPHLPVNALFGPTSGTSPSDCSTGANQWGYSQRCDLCHCGTLDALPHAGRVPLHRVPL